MKPKESKYSKKLRDPRWQKMRLQIMGRDSWACILCGDATSTLNVHHEYYQHGFNPWDYPAESLLTLCEACHELNHYSGDLVFLKEYLVSRYCHGTMLSHGVTYLFNLHHLHAL